MGIAYEQSRNISDHPKYQSAFNSKTLRSYAFQVSYSETLA